MNADDGSLLTFGPRTGKTIEALAARAPAVRAMTAVQAKGNVPAASGTAKRPARLRGTLLISGLAAALVVTVIAGASLGQVSIPPAEVLGSIAHRLGLDIGPMPSGPQGDNALWVVRFPRVVLAVVTGAALGCGGAMMQGIFGNPLAEPGVIGVSAGAATGAATVIVFGLTAFGNWTVVLAAFAAGWPPRCWSTRCRGRADAPRSSRCCSPASR